MSPVKNPHFAFPKTLTMGQMVLTQQMSLFSLFCLLSMANGLAWPPARFGLPSLRLNPPWSATWNMSLSTAFMPCDANGPRPVPFPPAVAARWGIADTDWSNGREAYSKAAPMDCEEMLLAQAVANHALNPAAKQMVYRNAIKSLPWFSSVREKLENRAYWGYFLPLKGCADYSCGPNATQNLYHDALQTPHGDCGEGVECGEYLFDLRNASCREWLRTDYLLGPTGLGAPEIKGFSLSSLAFSISN